MLLGRGRSHFYAVCASRLAFVCLSSVLAAFAESSSLLLRLPDPTIEYQHRIWNREQGLPDNDVCAVLQTRDGYLWAATRVGLARFDGRSFTVFNRANTPAMTDDDCRDLMEDRTGTLYVTPVPLRFS
ncbi:MAG: hypothetical protein HY043_13430 [Verrucomicrobia bacterium]|nr:hypothetical protein [Verrucomicrobiota bacterium]